MNFRPPSLISRFFEAAVMFGIACLIIRAGINYLWPVRWIIICLLVTVIMIPIIWRIRRLFRRWYDWRHGDDRW